MFSAILVLAGLTMVSCGTKKRTLEDYKQEAEKFKSELPESYVVLGECIDSLVQKVYYTNRVSPVENAEPWQYNLDEFTDTKYPKQLLELIAKDTTDTFIKVYNIQTGDTTDIDFSKFSNVYGCGDKFDYLQCGIRFSYYANGKLFFSVPESRYGSSIYFINVYSDEVNKIIDSECVTNIRIEGNKLVYTNSSVTNDDEAEFSCDYHWATKDYTIDL